MKKYNRVSIENHKRNLKSEKKVKNAYLIEILLVLFIILFLIVIIR